MIERKKDKCNNMDENTRVHESIPHQVKVDNILSKGGKKKILGKLHLKIAS